MTIKERIKALAHETGFHACGMTLPQPVQEAEDIFRQWQEQGKHGEMAYLEQYEERRQSFWKRFSDAKSIIVLGINYFSKSETKSNGYLTGRVARYAWGRDYHKVISEKLELLKEKIKREVNDEVYFEPATDTKPLFERTLAQQAGLGFIGKQTQLLSLQFGPWLFLSELITNLKLEPDQPFQGSCGTCRLCIDECPTHAIEETGHVDARKCIAYLTIEHKTEIPMELREKIGNWVFGCDECLTVCPYTAKQKETDWKELTSEAGFGTELDLLQLFETKSNRDHKKKFAHSPISRASRKQLLRNACVVLGNLGSDTTLPILEKALDDPSPLVQDHARWAISQIKKVAKNVLL